MNTTIMSQRRFCTDLGITFRDFEILAKKGMPLIKVGSSYLVDSMAAGNWLHEQKDLRIGEWKEIKDASG